MTKDHKPTGSRTLILNSDVRDSIGLDYQVMLQRGGGGTGYENISYFSGNKLMMSLV